MRRALTYAIIPLSLFTLSLPACGDGQANTGFADLLAADMAGPADLAAPDLGDSDIAISMDLAPPPDLAIADLSMPDLAQPDLAPPIDLATIPPRRVFAGPLHDGNFGGITAAHMHCQNAAQAAGLGGAWKAILGSATEQPYAFISLAGGRDIARVDGTKVAAPTAFWSATHLAPINVRADKTTISDITCVWTAFGPTGGGSTTSCGGWTSNANITVGQAGDLTRADSRWYLDYNAACDRTCYVYCIEQ